MKPKIRRVVATILALIGISVWVANAPASYETTISKSDEESAVWNSDNRGDGPSRNEASAVMSSENSENPENSGESGGAENSVGPGASTNSNSPLATTILEKLEVKGRAPKTGYTRTEFYNGWPAVDGCNLRQRIIKREFGDTAVLDGCNVLAGEYDEPYTGEHKIFTARDQISKNIQIDHVVALSDAWQKGAQYLSAETRYQIATDPLNLLAVDSAANGQKSDGDAATWLPSNKKFRCQYVARQVSVKYKYSLWVTSAEKEAIGRILEACPNERAVGVE